MSFLDIKNPDEIIHKEDMRSIAGLWRGQHNNPDYKTDPCRYGGRCRNKRCNFSHTTFRGMVLIRCHGCFKKQCSANAIRQVRIKVNNHDTDVLCVCLGFSNALDAKMRAPSPRPVRVIQNNRRSKKRERSPDIPAPIKLQSKESVDDYLELNVDDRTRKALKVMLDVPNSNIRVRIPNNGIIDILRGMPVEDVLSLQPMLSDVPNVSILFENIRMAEQIAVLKKEAAESQKTSREPSYDHQYIC